MEILDRVSGEKPPAYAGFTIRVAAWLTDIILVAIFGWATGLIIGVNPVVHSRGMAWYGSILVFFYFLFMEAGPRQGTFGKQILGLRVVDAAGQRISLRTSLIRSLSKILSFLLLFAGFLLVAFTEKKQGLHDLIAGTYVIREPL